MIYGWIPYSQGSHTVGVLSIETQTAPYGADQQDEHHRQKGQQGNR